MAQDACKFCESKEIHVAMPYVNGMGETQYRYCCLAQKKNHEFLHHHNAPYVKGSREITIDEVEEL